ncbi:unnamed protein product [Amoebophrya sp. A25]|nr:unnamed protein product [Amoebophrya sp. A25]|eukprot:GSA25T00024697001.1
MDASSSVATAAADRLSQPAKQTLREVEDEISAKLREIEALESELLVRDDEIRRSKQTTKQTEDATSQSLLSVGPEREVPGIRRLRRRPEDPRWKHLQTAPDPHEHARALLMESILPKPAPHESTFPKMPMHSLDEPPALSHDPLEWRLSRMF